MTKLLSGLLIGAFVFGVGAADLQPASAASISDAKAAKDKFDKSKKKFDQTKDKADKTRDKFDGKNPPEPPKDENGNPMPPPDKQDGDNSNRPEPPKDKNGNPLPPPDMKNGKKFSDTKDKFDKAKEVFSK